jgi:DNA-binding response OmpR family regulator
MTKVPVESKLLGRKILILDDDENFRLFLRKLLERYGVRVFEASDSFNALQTVLSERVELVFLDVNLVYESGMEFLKLLKELSGTREIPVIMVSADSDRKTVLLALSRGARDYIVKPIQVEILSKKLNGILFSKNPNKVVLTGENKNTVSVSCPAEIVAVGFDVLQVFSSCTLNYPSTVGLFGRFADYLRPKNTALSISVHAVSVAENGTLLEGIFGFSSIEARNGTKKLLEKWSHDEERRKPRLANSEIKTVCILDDDKNAIAILEKVLTKLGYLVRPFNRVDHLFDYLKSNPVRACLVDLWIDTRSVGFQVISAIRKTIGSEVGLYAVSGADSDQILADALEAGCDGYISKTTDFSTLSKNIELQLLKKDNELSSRVSELLYPPKGFIEASLCFDAELLEMDEFGIRIWSEHLIHKGVLWTLEKPKQEIKSWIDSSISSPLQFRVVTTGVNSASDRGGFIIYAEFEGEKESYEKFFFEIKKRLSCS